MKQVRKILALLTLTAMLLAALCSCGVSPTKKAETAVANMFTAFKALDFDKAQEYVDMDDMKLSEDTDDELMDYTTFMEALFDRLEYKIISSQEVDSENVDVVVDVTAVDMGPVLGDYLLQALQFTFSNAFSESPLSEEETDEKMAELFLECATKDDLKTVTTQVTIKVACVDGKWKVQPDDTMVDAVLGGIAAAAESLSDSFSD